MSSQNKRILNAFEANVESVRELANFDHIVLEFAISGLENCIAKLKRSHGIDNPYLVPINTLKNLQNVRQHDSLRPRYADMFNQCVVLLVSYLAVAMEEVFVANIARSIPTMTKPTILAEEIRISIADIQKAAYDVSSHIGEWIMKKKDISFQDMQSLRRAFSDYFSIEMPRDDYMNDIIFAQASRHIIVHRGGVINSRFLQQIKDASPRRVKAEVPTEGKILFDESDVTTIADSMVQFVRAIVLQLNRNQQGHVPIGFQGANGED